MSKAFQGFNHGTGVIDLTKHKEIEEFRPVEIHLKENGSLKNEPSFAIVMTSQFSMNQVVGQISLEMLNDGLSDIGYEVIKKKKNLFPPISDNKSTKVIRDGKVAILVSAGYGAGWYSWNLEHEQLLFHPKLVRMVEAGKQAEINDQWMRNELGIDNIYCGGAKDLSIHWLPEGTAFKIDEYDGSESLETDDDLNLIA